jgi:hypothetical protein
MAKNRQKHGYYRVNELANRGICCIFLTAERKRAASRSAARFNPGFIGVT